MTARVVGQIFVAAALVQLSATAAAAPAVDQQQSVIEASVGGVGIGGASEQTLAQVVTAGHSGALTAVRFPVACSSGVLVIEIQGVSGGGPDGVVAASTSVFAATLPSFFPGPPSFRTLAFVSPADVVAGTQFAVVLTSTGSCATFAGPVGDPYPGGDAFFDARPNPRGVWAAISTGSGRRDLAFQTMVDRGSGPSGTIDQEQPVIDTSVGGAAIGGHYQQTLAQVLTTSLSGNVTEVRVPVACSSGSLIVELQTVAGDRPTGTVVASRSVPAIDLPAFHPNPPVFRGIRFGTPGAVVAGDRLAIVLRSTGECGMFQGPVGNPYPGGTAFFDSRPNAPGWIAFSEFVNARDDLPFQVVVDTGTTATPIANAGADQRVTERSIVTLDGSASVSPTGGALTYEWTQVTGPPVTLALSDPARPTFAAPEVGLGEIALTFELRVSTSSTPGFTDSVTITVRNVDHVATERVLWTDANNGGTATGTLFSAGLSGTGVETLATLPFSNARFLALDAPAGKMYWADIGEIRRANVDGTGVETIVSGLLGPLGIAVDAAAGKLYWTDSVTRRIERANLDSSDREDLVGGLIDPRGLALDVEAGWVYWTDAGSHKIQRARLDGTEVADVVTGLGFPQGIALDTLRGTMFWPDNGGIMRAELDGSGARAVIRGSLGNPLGIAVDGLAGKMYWTETAGHRIQRANLDGGAVETVVTGAFDTPWGIALDVPLDRAAATITLGTTGNGSAAVMIRPAGTWCRGSCTETFLAGASVTLVAVPDRGVSLSGWSGCTSASGATCTVALETSRTVIAAFTTSRKLRVRMLGDGRGMVTSAPAGITCGTDCVHDYPLNTSVTLTATPASGSAVVGWTGCTSASGTTCTVTLDRAATVSARFSRARVPLRVRRSGSGTGNVVSSPAGIRCGRDCEEVYRGGTVVTLTATPANGSTFVGWDACPAPSSTTCTVPMHAARTVRATFAAGVTLTVTITGGSATVTSDAPGIVCPADCTQSYAPGTTVTLTAVPRFDTFTTQWSGCTSVSGRTCRVTMDKARAVTLSLVPPPG